MEKYYCTNCNKKTGHKRSIGLGTLLAVILTGGLWLLAIFFYPKRCILCGNWKRAPKPYPEANKENSANNLETNIKPGSEQLMQI